MSAGPRALLRSVRSGARGEPWTGAARQSATHTCMRLGAELQVHHPSHQAFESERRRVW